MSETTPIGFGLEVYVVFFAIMAVAIALTYWGMARVARKHREDFVASYAADALRVNAYTPTIVYQVVSEADGQITAVCVWRGKGLERDGERITAEAEHFAPFDEAAFLAAE